MLLVDAVTCRVEKSWASFILHQGTQAEKVTWDLSLWASVCILRAEKIQGVNSEENKSKKSQEGFYAKSSKLFKA